MKLLHYFILALLFSFGMLLFLAYRNIKLLQENERLSKQNKTIELELKLYKLQCKDEFLQKQIQDDMRNIRNAIEFFSDSTVSLPR